MAALPATTGTSSDGHTNAVSECLNGGSYLNHRWRSISTTTTGAYWKLITSIENGAQTSNYKPILCQYAPEATTKPSSYNNDDRRDVDATDA